MKWALSLLFVLIQFFLLAQKKGETYHSPFPAHLSYRTKILQSSPYKGLNNLENYKFNQPLNYVGISVFEQFNAGWLSWRQVVTLDWIIPKRVMADSCDYGVSGFQYGMVIIGKNLIRHNKTKRLIMDATIGFNTGRTVFSNARNGRFKNPFFAPKIALHPVFRVGRISLTFLFQYDYDISKTKWIEMASGNDNRIVPENLSQSGISASVNLGYMLRYESAKAKKIRQNKKKNKK